MRRCWWTVWIEVAIVAVLLFFGYKYVTGMVMDIVSPYLIEEHEVGERSDNLIKQMVEMVEEKFDFRVDYENLIFDYANDYAGEMMDQSKAERQYQVETFSVVEEYEDLNTETETD